MGRGIREREKGILDAMGDHLVRFFHARMALLARMGFAFANGGMHSRIGVACYERIWVVRNLGKTGPDSFVESDHRTPRLRVPTPIRECPQARMPKSPAEGSMMPWPFADAKTQSRMVLQPIPRGWNIPRGVLYPMG
jgi:hypothetical protein